MSAVAPAEVDAPVTLRQSPEFFPTIVPLAAAGAALADVAMPTPANPTPASVATAAVSAMTCRRSQLRGVTRDVPAAAPTACGGAACRELNLNILTKNPFGTSSPAGGIAAGWGETRVGAGFRLEPTVPVIASVRPRVVNLPYSNWSRPEGIVMAEIWKRTLFPQPPS